MAGMKKGAVIKLILKMIGGSPLMQVPTTTVGGFPVAAQIGAIAGAAAGAAAAVSAAMSAAGSIKDGMAVISKNPLGTVLDTTGARISSLTSGATPFAGLDASIPAGVLASVGSTEAYGNLKGALGGADGISGAQAQVTKFKEHTDRLSGLLPSSDTLEG